jgi:hypothetical protein
VTPWIRAMVGEVRHRLQNELCQSLLLPKLLTLYCTRFSS